MVPTRVLQAWSGPLLVVVTVIACAWFAARLVAHVGEAAAFDDRRPAAPAPVAPRPAPAQLAVPAGDDGGAAALVSRNMFCSTCAPAAAEPGDGVAPAGGAHAVPRLIATSVGVRESWATIDDAAAGVSGMFALGARLPGGGVIETIERGAITVRFPDNAVERVPLATAGAGKPPLVAGKPAPAAKDAPFADRVRAAGPNRWEVDRTLIRDLVQAGTGQGGAAKGVRLTPVNKDGNLAGLRVAGAREGSLARVLGLQPGDVIEAVDGRAIDSLEKLMDLYGRLDSTRKVELGIKRKGAPQTLTYDLL